MSDADTLARFFDRYPTIAVLTGAGCSTASGIPAYRDDDGEWMHSAPVQYADFIASDATRRRYWARSFIGWQNVGRAEPNAAHRALADLEQRGRITQLITQNVDDLHRAAGSNRVIDLHGRLSRVRCLDCGRISARSDLQFALERRNPDWAGRSLGAAPDGDARVADDDTRAFVVIDCEHCGGLLKPDVVFFGENVPAERVAACREAVDRADALLVVGSSLMVYSGLRFVREAKAAGKTIAIVNRGRTRADELADIKLGSDCGALLLETCQRLGDRE